MNTLQIISKLNTVYDKFPKPYPLEIIIKEIRTGKTTIANPADSFKHKTLAKYTEYARSKLQDTPGHDNNTLYQNLKKGLPQICPTAILETRSEIKAFSNIVCLEYDDPTLDFDSILADAAQNPHTLATFRSLSGKPKLLIRISDKSLCSEMLSRDTFRHAFDAANRIYEEHGSPDLACRKMPTHLQAYCYDPNAYLNLNATPLAWSIDETETDETETETQTAERLGNFSKLPDLHQQAILHIHDWKADGWSKEKIPCLWQDHENDSWEFTKNNGTAVKKNADHDYTLHCFKCGKTARFGPKKTRHAPIRLTQQIQAPQTQDIDTIRTLLNDSVKKWIQNTENTEDQHILILATGTGTGKTTAALTNINSFVDISPTTELAEEKYNDAIHEGIDAVRHRSRYYNRKAAEDYHPRDVKLGLDGEDTVPCVYPNICKSLYLKGYSPRYNYCEKRCTRKQECESVGYLSQFPIYSKVDAIFFSFDDDIFF